MRLSLKLSCLFAVVFAVTLVDASDNSVESFKLKPFTINLASEIPRLKALVNNTRLPAKALYPSAGQDKGIELDFLDELRTDWLQSFDWEKQQAELNA